MTNPLHASHYADNAFSRTAAVVENERLALDTWRLRVHCPDIAPRIRPGQFVMVRLHGWDDPLIGRPLALYETHGPQDSEPTDVEVVYLVKGKLTSRLRHVKPGQWIDVWGPLGNGFGPQACEHLIMVAGGIGQTPFLALAQQCLGRKAYGGVPLVAEPVRQVTFCYGARRAEYLAGVDDFLAAGVDVQVATDDGSAGHHGLVTEILERQLDVAKPGVCRIVACGPEPMMQSVARLAAERDVPCEVSLETPMACGIGICFSCVARVRDDSAPQDGHASGWDYKRTCVEGPVFDAARIVW